jgi:hypothetical protein
LLISDIRVRFHCLDKIFYYGHKKGGLYNRLFY